MLVDALVEYVRRRSDLVDKVEAAAFHREVVPWAVEISSNGRFVGVHARQETKTIRDKSVLVSQTLDMCAPFKSRNHGCALLGCDTAVYVLGPADSMSAAEAERAVDRHESFRQLHAEAASSVQSPLLKSCLKFLESKKQLERARKALNLKIESDRIALQVNDQIVIEDEDVRTWWDDHFQQKKAEELGNKGAVGRCMFTGETGPIEMSHTPIKVPGGPGKYGTNANGVRLISFNQPSMQHYGWKQGFNCPMSVEVATMLRVALEDLLSYDRAVSARLDMKKHVCLCWTQKSTDDDLIGCLNGNADAIDVMRKQPRTDTSSTVEDFQKGNMLYCLILGFNQSRTHIKYFNYDLVDRVRHNLCQWLEDTQVPSRYKAGTMARPVGIRNLAFHAMGREDFQSKAGARSRMEELLIRHALFREGVPHGLAERTVEHMVRESDEETRMHASFNVLLKLGLGTKEYERVNETMVGQLGRLLAWLHHLQESVAGCSRQRKPSLKVGDRFFAPLTRNPQGTVTRILRLGTAHLAKLTRYRPDIRDLYELEMGEICQKIEELGGVPERLTRSEQAQLGVAYRAGWLEKRKIKDDANEKRRRREAEEAKEAEEAEETNENSEEEFPDGEEEQEEDDQEEGEQEEGEQEED